MRTYLKNATLIDGTGAPAQPGSGLVIEGDTLVHVGRLDAVDERRRRRLVSSTWGDGRCSRDWWRRTSTSPTTT
jgi:hypothetical protein